MRLAFFQGGISFSIMNNVKRFSALILSVGAFAACGIFEDPTPETLSVRLTGPTDVQVRAIYAQAFVAGVNQETRTTEVRVSQSDTVLQMLPIDTVVNIAESRQLFIQVEPVPVDTLAVAVRVDVDARTILQREGSIWAAEPFRYVYQFNRPLTNIVEVVF